MAKVENTDPLAPQGPQRFIYRSYVMANDVPKHPRPQTNNLASIQHMQGAARKPTWRNTERENETVNVPMSSRQEHAYVHTEAGLPRTNPN